MDMPWPEYSEDRTVDPVVSWGLCQKACPSQNLAPPTQQSTTSKEAVGPDNSGQAPNGLNESQQVGKKGQKAVTPPPQQDAPQRRKHHHRRQQQQQQQRHNNSKNSNNNKFSSNN